MRHRLQSPTARWLAFPLGVVFAFAALVFLNLNGSSISALQAPGERSGVLAGTPRSIRSDELVIQTPLAISSAMRGFPESQWIGLTEASQLATSHAGAVAHWLTLFKPQDWGFLVLDVQRGVAFAWWWPFVVAALGSYALFGVLSKSPLRSALLAVIASFSPYLAWWSSPAPGLFLGYGAATGALLLMAWSSPSRVRALAAALGAATQAVALALALYPAWQVSIAAVIAVLCLGTVLDRRLAWLRVGWTTLAMVVATGAVLAFWYLHNYSAISASMHTYYPGNRRSVAGTAHLELLLSAPMNYWVAGEAGKDLGRIAGLVASNQSESSSVWLSLPLVVLLLAGSAHMVYQRLRPHPAAGPERPATTTASSEPLWSMLLVSVAICFLLAWALTPLPDWVGSATLFDRVPPGRVQLALGLAVLVQVALAAQVARRPPIWRWPWLTGSAILTAALGVWVWRTLPWDASLTPPWMAAASALAVGIGFSLASDPRSTRWGLGLLVGVTVTSFSVVNPVQQGLGGLEEDPLVKALTLATRGSANSRVELFGRYEDQAKVRIAGLESLGGVTPYPDPDLMTRLAPDRERLWNNYSQYMWEPLAPGAHTELEQIRGTLVTLKIDPCNPELLRRADPGWAVANEQLSEAACLDLRSSVEVPGFGTYWIYQRRR